MTELWIAMLCRCDRNKPSICRLGGFLCDSKCPSDLGMLTTGSSGGPRGLTEVFP